MDGISLYDAIVIYIILFVPLLTMFLLIGWTLLNRKNISKFKSLTMVIMFGMQIVYYLIIFLFLKLENNLGIALVTIIPICALTLLYSRVFGHRKKSYGRIIMVVVFFLQVLLAIATFSLSLTAHFN